MECRGLPGNPSVSSIKLLESGRLDDDWKILCNMREFGPRAYFVNIPSKFVGSDGMTMWMLYPGNFSLDSAGSPQRLNPPAGRYGITMRNIELPGI